MDRINNRILRLVGVPVILVRGSSNIILTGSQHEKGTLHLWKATLEQLKYTLACQSLGPSEPQHINYRDNGALNRIYTSRCPYTLLN